MYKGEIKVDQLTIVQSCGTPPVFWLVWYAAGLSSHWMKTAASASADQRVFSNIEQINVWIGNYLICSLLYISSWLQGSEERLDLDQLPCSELQLGDGELYSILCRLVNHWQHLRLMQHSWHQYKIRGTILSFQNDDYELWILWWETSTWFRLPRS